MPHTPCYVLRVCIEIYSHVSQNYDASIVTLIAVKHSRKLPVESRSFQFHCQMSKYPPKYNTLNTWMTHFSECSAYDIM